MLTKFSAIVLLTSAFSAAEIQRNPIFSKAQFNSNEYPLKQKTIHQWNTPIALPISGQMRQQQAQSGQPSEAPSPGYVWLQIPASPSQTQKPLVVGQTKPPTFVPPKQGVSSEILLSGNPPVSSGIHQSLGQTHVSIQKPSGELSKQCLRANGQFPTNTCNRFINCWNGIAMEQSCPDGLVFSARGLYCDYPERVDCSQRTLGTVAPATAPQAHTPSVQATQGALSSSPISAVHTTQILPVATGISRQGCIQARGQFPTNTCNKYVNCWDGAAVEQFCPPGLLFNPSKLHCDYPENVNCNGKLIVGSSPATGIQGDTSTTFVPPNYSPSTSTVFLQTTSTSPSAPSTNFDPILKRKCLTARGIFPSVACSKFVSCWDDTVEEKECPEGFLFSTNGYCDAAENVNCGERLKSVEDTVNGLECPQESGTFRDKGKCNSYYTCVFNKVIARFQCPEGLNFNDKIGVCDYADRVECSNDPSKYQNKEKNSECPLENGTFRNKTVCSSFYTCLSNKIVAKYDCPDGFSFNDNIGVCDYANRVDCSKEPLIYQGRGGIHTKKDSVGSDCPVEFGTYRDSKNCSSYYTCASKKIVAKYDCPEGFSFNEDIGVCDYAERVDCSKPPKIFQIKPNGIAQFPTDLQERVDKCKPGMMFRLNPQCTSACLCRNGVAEIVQCPAGLSYDSRADKCILPHLARC